MQGSNGNTVIENRLMDTGGGGRRTDLQTQAREEGEGWKNGESSMETYPLPYVT